MRASDVSSGLPPRKKAAAIADQRKELNTRLNVRIFKCKNFQSRIVKRVSFQNILSRINVHVRFESHRRQLIFLRKVDCLGVLCCFALLPCCLFDLACFFLPSFSSLIKTCIYITYKRTVAAATQLVSK